VPASPLDGDLHAGLLAEPGTQAWLSDEAEVRAMLAVEAALARAQGEAGLIPADAAEALARGIEGAEVEPRDLGVGTARDGAPVPALLGLLRARLPVEAAGWLHWGATSQDIVDTALMLRVRG
jgi:3-carboxy-cis,cis-muconate cycloisomerase